MKKQFFLFLFVVTFTTFISAQNVGVDVASPTEKLDVLGAIRIGNTSNNNTGTIRWNSPNFQGYDGTQWVNFGGGTVTGNGTATRVAFWSGTSSLSSNANLYWDNTNSRLGVGLANPLGVVSAGSTFGNKVLAYDDGTNAAGLGIQAGALQMFTSNNTSNIVFGHGSSGSFTENVRFMGTGNVGIGTTAPGAKLEIAGQVKITGGTPGSNKVLTSDAAGLATWQTVTGLFTETDPQVSSTSTGRVPRWNGTALVDGIISDDGLNQAVIGSSNILVGIGNLSGVATVYGWNQGINNHGPLSLRATSGTQLYLNTDGNVGINTTTPGAKLEVSGQVKITGGTPALNQVLTSDASGLATWEPAQGDNLGNHIATQNIQLNSNWLSNDGGSEGVRIDNNGNVGIGQTPGSAYLDITGTNAGTTSLQLRSGNAGNTFTSNQVVMGYNNTENYRHAIKTRHQSGGTANAIDFFIWDQPNDPAATVGTLNVMSVTGLNNGSVGIGVNSPGAQLHTTGSVRFAGLTSATQTSAVMTDGSGNLSTRALNDVAFSGDLPSGDGDYIQNQSVGANFATGQNASFDIQSNAEIGGTLSVNNNIGIGSTTPGSPLDIVKNGGNSAMFRNTNANNYSGIRFYNDQNSNVRSLEIDYSGSAYTLPLMAGGLTGEAASIATTGAYPLQLGTNNTLRMMITGAGNVGIGTNAPTLGFFVEKDNGNGWAALIRSNNLANGLLIGSRNSTASIQGISSDGNSVRTVSINQDGGSVGIGTTTPDMTGNSAAVKVAIHSSAATSFGELTVGGTHTGLNNFVSSLGFTNGALGTTDKRIASIFAQTDGAANSGNMQFFTYNAGVGGERMRIDKAGNVGIGQPAPSATLDVVGTVEMFGAWTARSSGTVYQADRDGFVIAWAGGSYFRILTDGANPPTVTRMETEGNTGNASRPNIMCPVRKGDYWKIEVGSGGTPTVWWMPLGQ